MTSLQKLIKRLQKVDKNCDEVKYSLDDVYELRRISDELKEEARLIAQCCS